MSWLHLLTCFSPACFVLPVTLWALDLPLYACRGFWDVKPRTLDADSCNLLVKWLQPSTQQYASSSVLDSSSSVSVI